MTNKACNGCFDFRFSVGLWLTLALAVGCQSEFENCQQRRSCATPEGEDSAGAAGDSGEAGGTGDAGDSGAAGSRAGSGGQTSAPAAAGAGGGDDEPIACASDDDCD